MRVGNKSLPALNPAVMIMDNLQKEKSEEQIPSEDWAVCRAGNEGWERLCLRHASVLCFSVTAQMLQLRQQSVHISHQPKMLWRREMFDWHLWGYTVGTFLQRSSSWRCRREMAYTTVINQLHRTAVQMESQQPWKILYSCLSVNGFIVHSLLKNINTIFKQSIKAPSWCKEVKQMASAVRRENSSCEAVTQVERAPSS